MFMINFITWLQQFESPFLNVFFLIISHITGEAVFLLILGFIYWCVNKEKGYTLCITMIASFSLNTALKNIFKIPRPYVLSSDVKQLDLKTGYGYSFPSGHAQLSSTMGGMLSFVFKYKAVILCSSVFVLLTGISRMYLGVHTPADILTGYIIGAAVTFAGLWVIKHPKYRHIAAVIILTLSHTILFLTTETDLLKMLGVAAGFTLGSVIEEKYICFNAGGKKFLRLFCGFTIIFSLKLVLSLLHVPAYVQYALLGFAVTAAVPAVFAKAEKYFETR